MRSLSSEAARDEGADVALLGDLKETSESLCPPRQTDKTEHAMELAERTRVTVSGFSHDFSFPCVYSFRQSCIHRIVVTGTHWVRKFQIGKKKSLK